MKLLVAVDSSMYKTPDGKYWCHTIYEYSFFERYLQVFDEIVVASRVKETNYNEVEGLLRCDGPRMTVADLPDMHGISGYFKNIFSFVKSAKVAANNSDCAIIRLPSVSAFMVLHFFKKTRKKYALEVVVDPETAYEENKASKILFTKLLKKYCRKADGVSYVTSEFLQKKYPSYTRIHGDDGHHFESFYSTIRLNEEYFGLPKDYTGKKTFTIIHTANNMNNHIKGHEVLLDSVSKVINSGYDVCLRFVGDGLLKGKFIEKSKSLGIYEKVTFVGRLSESNAVREELISSDLFVFPTKAEGLPRSVIEAMAVGLPCISTPVAGIPELLETEDMKDPLDVNGFASRIIEFISNPDLMNEKSK
ncbi:MAG: glycosyltransferase family 4 protein, partial [Clostridia bacterium]|nr:glycosyltransferase family 4 protein [Clostridia bacterium]